MKANFGYSAIVSPPGQRLLRRHRANASLTHTYDKLGNLTFNSQVGTYTYPTSGPTSVRPHAVTTAGSNPYSYDGNGNVTGGAGWSLTYDPASQLTSILHQLTATSSQINKADYVYNAVGNRTSLTDRRGPQTFGSDQLDRLTSASHPLRLDLQSFAYRCGRESHHGRCCRECEESATYDGRNRLLSITDSHGRRRRAATSCSPTMPSINSSGRPCQAAR